MTTNASGIKYLNKLDCSSIFHAMMFHGPELGVRPCAPPLPLYRYAGTATAGPRYLRPLMFSWSRRPPPPRGPSSLASARRGEQEELIAQRRPPPKAALSRTRTQWRDRIPFLERGVRGGGGETGFTREPPHGSVAVSHVVWDRGGVCQKLWDTLVRFKQCVLGGGG